MNASKKIFGFIIIAILFAGIFTGCENASGENISRDNGTNVWTNERWPIVGYVTITDIPSKYIGLWATFHAGDDIHNWGSFEGSTEDLQERLFAKIKGSTIKVTMRDLNQNNDIPNGSQGYGCGKSDAAIVIRLTESGTYGSPMVAKIFFKEVNFKNGNATVSCNQESSGWLEY